MAARPMPNRAKEVGSGIGLIVPMIPELAVSSAFPFGSLFDVSATLVTAVVNPYPTPLAGPDALSKKTMA